MKRRLITVAITTAWLIAGGMALIFGSLMRIVLFVYFRGIWPVLDWWRWGRHHGRLFSEIWKRP